VKAIVYREYGSPAVLRLEDVAKPTPKPDEVLIKVMAVTLNRSDWEGLTGEPLYARIGGFRRPRHAILGSDVAGRVEAVGNKVERLRPGDEVFGDILWHMGGLAEHVCAREKFLAIKPAGLSFEHAAAIPQAGVIALKGIRDKGRVAAGHNVLINGAGGGGGTFAVQLAKLYGAKVTAVDHGDKRDLLRALGADEFVDYTREDFTRTGKQYDLILDLIAHRSVFDYRRALKPGGRSYVVGGATSVLFATLFLGPLVGTRGKKLRILVVEPNVPDLLHLAELCATGKISPILDARKFSLAGAPEALRLLGEGRAKGKVLITFNEANEIATGLPEASRG
jgi:NADPH:quinone reductase-like Zn-dependent oxidoreductase